jgi:hypothetical protein
VRVVEYGYLFPLGHRAVTVQVTDRIFAPDPAEPDLYADAYLQLKVYIRVLDALKYYPALGQPYNGSSWPFTSAKLLTLVTPDLDAPASIPALAGTSIAPNGYPQAFFPTFQSGNDVLWSVHLEDTAGTTVALKLPLVFVSAFDSSEPKLLNQYSASAMQQIASAYNALGLQSGGPSTRVTSPVAGTPVRYAPEVTANEVTHSGATTHPTLAIILGAATTVNVPTSAAALKGSQAVPPVPAASQTPESTLAAANQPAFFPCILTAQVRLPAAETLSRSPLDDPDGAGGVAIGYYGNYVAGGFAGGGSIPANLGSVYAGLLNAPSLKFPADMVGGLANPNLPISGLSAVAGAIGGSLSQYANNAAALVADYFGDLTNSNFLGGLSLANILGVLEGGTPTIPQIPNITREIDPTTGTITVTYTLAIPLTSFPSSEPFFSPLGDNAMMTLTATVVVTLSGSTTFMVKGSIDPFQITILGTGTLSVIQIPFGSTSDSTPGVAFSASSGAKTNIKVNVGSPTFIGVLSFVNTLEQFLDNIGGSGISIDVEPTQVSASLTLALPSVGCGVLNLENLSLSANVVVPFLGGTTVATFGFCSQDQPFTLTVMCFGGGGYLILGVGLTSIQSFTASFDFEGQFALDLGVASGGVSLVAGITFSYVNTTGASLTGFVRITGEVEVLGILSITLQVDLSLTYDFSSNKATGTATMTVSISLCFFSISVGITVKKSFGGGSSSSSPAARPAIARTTSATNPFANDTPTFEDQMPELSDWVNYCDAFAS